MTTTDDRLRMIVAACAACRETSSLRLPQSCHLTLYTHGVMALRFFCLHCRELTSARISDVDFARRLTETGVATTIVRVPEEMFEHPPEGTRNVTEVECRYWESVPLQSVNEARARELR
jgi:hypothetical protein